MPIWARIFCAIDFLSANGFGYPLNTFVYIADYLLIITTAHATKEFPPTD